MSAEKMTEDFLRTLLKGDHTSLKEWAKRYSVHIGYARTPISERRDRAVREILRRIFDPSGGER